MTATSLALRPAVPVPAAPVPATPSLSALVGDEDLLAAANHRAVATGYVARPVALVGFMGVGKTSVGRELARLLDRPFVDTDAAVERRSGRTIPELFAQGEPVFRRLEREAVQEALAGPPGVLALGGGAFSAPGSAQLLLARALVVHLYVPWTVVHAALAELAVDRPLLTGQSPGQVQDLFLRRCRDYRRAHLRVCLPRRDVAEAAAAVAAVINRRVELVSSPP